LTRERVLAHICRARVEAWRAEGEVEAPAAHEPLAEARRDRAGVRVEYGEPALR